MIAPAEQVGVGSIPSLEELQKTISASRLNTWLSCRVKWDKDEEPGEKQMGLSLLELYFKETPIPANEMKGGR